MEILARKEHQICFCTHADRIYSLDLPSSIWRVERAKAKMHRKWEPDDDLQAVSDIQDQHVCVRTCCVRWKSIVVSLIGGGNFSKERASNLLCTHADRIYSLDLPSSIWRVERAKAKMHRNGSQMMTCRPFRIIQDQHVCVRTSCVRWTSIVTSLIGVGKILARKEHQICFAPMLTGSTVWTFHLQYEGWKGQKQRCIAMGVQMIDLQAVSDIQDQHVCVRTCCVRWTSIVVSLIGGGKIVARKEHQICFAPMLTGSTVWTFHLQYEGWKG